MSDYNNKLRKRGKINSCVLVLLIISVLFVISSFIFNAIWLILLPVILVILAVVQSRSDYFWDKKKYCERCNNQINSVYSEFCRNCGLKLINKCPSCGKYVKTNIEFCNNCGHEMRRSSELEKPFEYKILERGASSPERANFCPTCGVRLTSQDNLEFCEHCGSKIE